MTFGASWTILDGFLGPLEIGLGAKTTQQIQYGDLLAPGDGPKAEKKIFGGVWKRHEHLMKKK